MHLNKETGQESKKGSAEQTVARARRGRLKIFLGYAPGVGKTRAMLEAGISRKSEGQHVLAAVVETHGRPEIDALLSRLETFSTDHMAGRDGSHKRSYLDSALATLPDLVLVDDLAHPSASAARHTRRYQEILELLDAGLSVYTTLDIYRLESLKDDVRQITGRELEITVPDIVLDRADSIEVVDLPIEELQQRWRDLERGGDRRVSSLDEEFVRPGNLAAFRELVLRRAAEHIDIELRDYMRAHAIPGPWPASERLLVCVSPSPLSARLVRKTRQMAEQLQASWSALFVETPRATPMSEEARSRVSDSLQLAERLGGRSLTLAGESVADTVIAYARTQNVTKIIAGKPIRRRLSDILRGSIVDRIVRQSGNIDVYVISTTQDMRSQAKGLRIPADESRTKGWKKLVWSGVIVVVATLMALPLRPHVEPTNLVMLYLLVTLGTALRLGRGPAMLSSFLGVLAFDVTFVPPYYKIVVADSQYIFTFFVLLSVGLIVSNLTARARDQAQVAQRRATETAVLFELSTDLAKAAGRGDVAAAVIQHVEQVLDARAALLAAGESGVEVVGASDAFEVEDSEVDAADWVYERGTPAGRGTDTYQDLDAYYLPLRTRRQVVGVLAVQVIDRASGLTSDQVHLLQSFASQAALALERANLGEQAREAEVLERTKRLQEALLDSVSHDLRTPLVSIMGALSSLKQDHALLPEQTRRELIDMSYEEVMRMNRLIGNLLEMTELESGALEIQREACDAEDLLGVALDQLGQRVNGHPVKLTIPEDLPDLQVDFALMVQVLVNLLDNAAKYTGDGMPIEISVLDSSEHIVIEICDYGPGIPPDELSSIFNKFHRVRHRNRASGTGLGLSIAKGLVHAHDGEITAENRADQGAKFTVMLPKVLNRRMQLRT